MDDLTAERYDPRRAVKMAAIVAEGRRRPRPRPRDLPDQSPPSSYELTEKRRRILLGKELPEDAEPGEYPQVIHRVVHRKPVTPQGK